MVHLAPLPGSPQYAGSIEAVLRPALADASALAEAGFPALMVENFGDAPFFADAVPAATVAALTRVVTEIRAEVALEVGVNVLRNDAGAALAVAAATGASMIRVNVLSGTMFTDQGAVTGRAAEVARLRAVLAPEVGVLADVFVKHAVPPPGLTLEQAALDTWERAGATALVVSGSGTGVAVNLEDLRRVRAAVPDAPLVVGSGATPETLAAIAPLAGSVIVGTALKLGGVASPVDPARARRFVEAASWAWPD
jgi:hypothetical protein